MLPLFYNHQALGDDFLLDIADTKFGYYVPDQGNNIKSNLKKNRLQKKCHQILTKFISDHP